MFRKKVRISEHVKQAELTNEDKAPLYSSFTDDQQYHYAQTAAVLQKIEEEDKEEVGNQFCFNTWQQ